MTRNLAFAVTIALTGVARADVDSGPSAGDAVPKLSVHCVTGGSAGKTVDVATLRGDKTTIYAFVRHDRFSRPAGRFLKTLDDSIRKREDGASVVAVWITDDPAAVREHLPRIQQSLQFQATELAVHEAEKAAPAAWGVNGDADLTVVVARDGKVVRSFGFVAVNDTVVKDVEAAIPLKPAK